MTTFLVIPQIIGVVDRIFGVLLAENLKRDSIVHIVSGTRNIVLKYSTVSRMTCVYTYFYHSLYSSDA